MPLTPQRTPGRLNALSVTQFLLPCNEVAGCDPMCVHRQVCTPRHVGRYRTHRHRYKETQADTCTLRDGPDARTTLQMHREMLTCRESRTHVKAYTCQHTDGYTQRQAKTLPVKWMHTLTHTHTNMHTDTHSPLPIFLARLHVEKLLEKKNNVRACGGGEGGRKSKCQPGSLGCARNGGWRWVGGPGAQAPVCWALPAAPKLRG